MDIEILGTDKPGVDSEATLAALAKAPLPEGWVYIQVDYTQADGKVAVLAQNGDIRAARADTLDDAITRLIDRIGFEEQYNRLKEEIVLLRSEMASLKLYTDPKLFAAASDIWALWAKPQGYEVLEGAMSRLAEAIAWWDALPDVGEVKV